MAKAFDSTMNVSGAENRCPPCNPKRTFITDLIDGFIKDGWIKPEDRWMEIAHLYEGDGSAERRKSLAVRNRREAEIYASGWIARWMEADHDR